MDAKAAKHDQQAARSQKKHISAVIIVLARYEGAQLFHTSTRSLVMSIALAMAFFSQAGNAGGSLVLHDRVPTPCRYHRQASRERTVPLAHLQ